MLHRRIRISQAAPVSRRATLRFGLGSLAAGLALSGRQASATRAQAEPATFVLVPGQWTGAFVWHTVTPLLRAAGHTVHAVTCTGLGDRVHLANAAIDLDTFITDVVNVLEFEDLHDVHLVGHSFGGQIITGVAERAPERLAQLIYLDASVPTDGQNNYEADMLPPDVANAAIAADIAGGMADAMPGFRPVFPEVKDWLRGAITDQDEAEWFISRLTPHPELSNLQPIAIANPAAVELPRAFILCTADKDMTADPQTDPYVRTVELVRSSPNWRVIEMNDTHMVNLNDPQGTADALISLL